MNMELWLWMGELSVYYRIIVEDEFHFHRKEKMLFIKIWCQTWVSSQILLSRQNSINLVRTCTPWTWSEHFLPHYITAPESSTGSCRIDSSGTTVLPSRQCSSKFEFYPLGEPHPPRAKLVFKQWVLVSKKRNYLLMYKNRGAKRYWNTGSIRINTSNSRKLLISYSTYL